MDTEKALQAFMGDPPGAAPYIKELLVTRNITDAEASRQMNISKSTLSRLLKGGELTVSMAAKIHAFLGMDVDLLFKMEAKRKAWQAKQLVKKCHA